MSAPDALELLLPTPKRVVRSGPGPCLAARLALAPGSAEPASAPWSRRLAAELARRGLALDAAATSWTSAQPPGARLAEIEVRREPGHAPQGYRLELAPRRVRLAASDDAGLLHAVLTLAQIAQLAGRPAPGGGLELPGLAIEDAPDFALRGVQLDVSRDKVPTLATLRALVERLARFKINHLQLYTEHAFAYRGHAVVWQDASPYAPEEIRALGRHCAEHGIELAPNQQSFGHLHRWLAHERYRALSEVPDGIVHPFGLEREPYGLCPTDPRALEWIDELHGQLLACFPRAPDGETSGDGLFNVGFDEPIDLGQGRSANVARARGAPALYLDFLRALHARIAARGRRMQVYGDYLAAHPELLPALPPELCVIAWGYEAGHDFVRELEPLARAGLERWVAPGTSSWQSFGGRTDNALANLAEAARAGRAHGARGYLITDWGDRGHFQPLCVSWPGFVQGAALGWNADEPALRERLAARIDRLVFDDANAGLGRPLLALGDVHARSGSPAVNGGALFFAVVFAEEELPHARLPGLARAGLARALAALDETKGALVDARPTGPEAELAARELGWAATLLGFGARLADARLASDPPSSVAALARERARPLADELAAAIEALEPLWLARNRAGGLSRSRERLAVLQRALAALPPRARAR